MDEIKVLEALDIILSFDRTALLSALSMKNHSTESVEKVKKACGIITEAGLYMFDLECTEVELLMQIEKFIQQALKYE